MSTSSQLRGCVCMVLYVVVMQVISQLNMVCVCKTGAIISRGIGKTFWLGGAQSETTHIVSNLYNNL